MSRRRTWFRFVVDAELARARLAIHELLDAFPLLAVHRNGDLVHKRSKFMRTSYKCSKVVSTSFVSICDSDTLFLMVEKKVLPQKKIPIKLSYCSTCNSDVHFSTLDNTIIMIILQMVTCCFLKSGCVRKRVPGIVFV